MQEITRDALVSKATELLANGTVDRVLGWKRGEFDYDITPARFTTAESLAQDFVFGDFCGANFSKYLVKECNGAGKVLVFLKPCDTYSFNQLLTEHRFDREQVYAVGIPCSGMLDAGKLKAAADGIAAVHADGDQVVIDTLYDGAVTLDSGRFDEVAQLEQMTPDERFAFWQGELSRCIRCNACRDVCPACTCEKCVFDNPNSGVENKAAANSFEEKMFHIIRAFHVAGRCTDCGECSRVCPQHIPLHLLNRKFIKDIDAFYGEYQAGAEVGSRAPIVNYTTSDLEPGEAVEGGRADA